MNKIIKSLKLVLSSLPYSILAISISINFLFLFYAIFLKTTSIEIFRQSNTDIYNLIYLVLTVANAMLLGLALTSTIYIMERKRGLSGSRGTRGWFTGGFLGAISSGCPSCGAYLLPLLGIAGSLSAFPLQGLEIKTIATLLAAFALFESAKTILGECKAEKTKLFSSDESNFLITINKETLPRLKPLAMILLLVAIVYALPYMPKKYKINFARQSSLSTASNTEIKVNNEDLISQVNPERGFTLNASFKDAGPQMIELGVIDYNKIKSIYDSSAYPLTDEQIEILTKGSNSKITINKENSYFLINFFWALGLANKNALLDEGPITKYGKDKIANFASTGGWSLGKDENAMKYYSSRSIVTLSPDQQKIIEEAANNTYRPCCNNSTAVADCNHGMAMLGLYELMASQGASLDNLYEAGKYFNAFWFPQQYLDIAIYFKAKEGKDFASINAKEILGSDYSSGSGWGNVRKWLSNNNLIEKVPSSGGGCGV